MGQSTPIQTRNRIKTTPMTVEDAQARADELFASARLLPVDNARTDVLKEACDFRMLAEMKRLMTSPKGSSPAG